MSITDVTELYLEEQEKNEKLQEALDNAQRANDITNQFMARMSHDMRTPMNGILGMARLSWDEMDIDEIKRNMVKIEKSGKYLLGLINDTLDYQIISSKKMKLNPVVFNPNTMLQNVESMVRVTADEKNVELRMKINIPDMKWDVRGDELRIQQICMNLLSNAIKFTPSGGTVEFVLEELSCDGNISHDLIVVRDSGIGMTQEFIETGLFKPLSQEKNDYTRTYAGSGLGLSIVKSLVELMGGHIEVHSEIGEGTEIRVYLNAERVPRSQSQIMQPVEEEDFANLQGKRILIVEDNSLNAEIAKHLLENKGCITLTAENGALGLECFAKSAPNELDLIVMDIRMPVMDGLEATRQIRKLSRPDAQTVPIIAMTANAFDRDIQACREAGMTDHLVKPVDPTKLYRTLVRNLHTMDVPRG